MDVFPVVIVGAGPAGLSLALSLARYEVSSIILEKELSIGEDPRGVYLDGDAVRILYQLGIGDKMRDIGHGIQYVNFHKTNFQNPAFFKIEVATDWAEQSVPGGIFQVQPRLEKALRDQIEKSPYCKLQSGATVISREDMDDGVVVGYEDNEGGILHKIRCSWLVGADGKKGVVRKRFLEPTAGIIQETGLSSYEGTWIAANLHIKLPTPETHPEFPLWRLGFSSLEVYDLFWPKDWHFCSPLGGKPIATGRFGPIEDRLWRHEFAEPDWNDSKSPEDLLWENMLPLITRDSDASGKSLPVRGVTFPRDCIEILRCRPFTFCQKVVNKWFHKRTILIGDAAHVFPPFGGQGIACGVRDAHGLAWRLAILLRFSSVTASLADKVLTAWSLEQRKAVDIATRMTVANGKLATEPETLSFYIFRHVLYLLSYFPWAPNASSNTTHMAQYGYKSCKEGFFLSEYGGGGRIAQIFLKSQKDGPLLSDQLLKRGTTIMTLLIINPDTNAERSNVDAILSANKIPRFILSEKSIMFLSTNKEDTTEVAYTTNKVEEVYKPCSRSELYRMEVPPGYNESVYLSRLLKGAKYALIRPDSFIFSVAKSLPELKLCVEMLASRLE